MERLTHDFVGPEGQANWDRGLWSEPIRQAFNSKKFSHVEKQNLRQVFTNSYPTASKLHNRGYAISPVCVYCGKSDTVWHRCWECEGEDGFLARLRREGG
eukprot:2374893-Pyramimonas_sp.AAC.1